MFSEILVGVAEKTDVALMKEQTNIKIIMWCYTSLYLLVYVLCSWTVLNWSKLYILIFVIGET